jgi:hypothetical protein
MKKWLGVIVAHGAVVAVTVACRQVPPNADAGAQLSQDSSTSRFVEPTGLEPGDAAAPPKAEDLGCNSSPSVAGARKRMAGIPLSRVEHGIQGCLELWRDRRIVSDVVQRYWSAAAFVDANAPPEFGARPIASAQLVLRDAEGKIRESLDFGLALVTLETRRLGDDPAAYGEVTLDTHRGSSRWGGSTTRFVRVEGGHARWLSCEAFRCSLGCDFSFDARPSGGFDVLTVMQASGRDTVPIRELERITVVGGRCMRAKTVVPGWGESGLARVRIPPVEAFPPPLPH